MKKVILGIILISLFASPCFAKKYKDYYWIKAGVTVLGFVGEPNSLSFTPIKFTTAKKQKVKFFHPNSGPGVRAFYLTNLVVFDQYKKPVLVKEKGYFVTKIRHLMGYKKKKVIIKRIPVVKQKSKKKEVKPYEPNVRKLPERESAPDIW